MSLNLVLESLKVWARAETLLLPLTGPGTAKAARRALYKGKLRTESKAWGPCHADTSLNEGIRIEKES